MRSWRGWTIEHVRKYVSRLIARVGIRQAARMCGVSVYTLNKFERGQEVSLGTIVKIAETMP